MRVFEKEPRGFCGGAGMKILTIKNGELYLDDEKVECIKAYKISSSAKDKGVAELEITMDVLIRRSEP